MSPCPAAVVVSPIVERSPLVVLPKVLLTFLVAPVAVLPTLSVTCLTGFPTPPGSCSAPLPATPVTPPTTALAPEVAVPDAVSTTPVAAPTPLFNVPVAAPVTLVTGPRSSFRGAFFLTGVGLGEDPSLLGGCCNVNVSIGGSSEAVGAFFTVGFAEAAGVLAAGSGFFVPTGVRAGAGFAAGTVFFTGVAPPVDGAVFLTGVGPVPADAVLFALEATGNGFFVPIGVLGLAVDALAAVDVAVFLTGVAVFLTAGEAVFVGVLVDCETGFFTDPGALAGLLFAPSATFDMPAMVTVSPRISI